MSPRAGPRTPANEWSRVTSRASAKVSGGRMPDSRCASMDLPAPGGPTRSRWWPPAAAISSARRATAWPRTSARSSAPALLSSLGAGSCRGSSVPRSHSAASSSRATGCTTRPSISAASGAAAVGHRRTAAPAARVASASARVPRPCRTRPSSDSSPSAAVRARRSCGTCSMAASTPSATARSVEAPSLGRSAGARLTVTLRSGGPNPE
jgi:hypothetical protein